MRCHRFAKCRHSGCKILLKHYIYMLVDIRTMFPFYVGETLHPRRRYAEHVRGSFDPVLENYGKQVSIRSLIGDDLYPSMIIIDCIESDCKQEVGFIEEKYADLLRENGIAVENGGTLRIDPQYLERELEVFRTLREMFLYG